MTLLRVVVTPLKNKNKTYIIGLKLFQSFIIEGIPTKKKSVGITLLGLKGIPVQILVSNRLKKTLPELLFIN